MSNWLDIRIRLRVESPDVEDVVADYRSYFRRQTRFDPNAPIDLGTADKFVWCYVKQVDDYASIIGNVRTGFEATAAANLYRWMRQQFPNHKYDRFELNARDDESRIFQHYTWKSTDPQVMIGRWIPAENYPVLHHDVNEYTATALERLQASLRQHGFRTVITL